MVRKQPRWAAPGTVGNGGAALASELDERANRHSRLGLDLEARDGDAHWPRMAALAAKRAGAVDKPQLLGDTAICRGVVALPSESETV